MTSIKWTREARKCGFGGTWGDLKGHAYFRDKVKGWSNDKMVAYFQSKKTGKAQFYQKNGRY